MRRIALVVAFVFLPFSSGCGTFLSNAVPHGGPQALPGPYSGLKTDVLLIPEAFADNPLTGLWVTPLAIADMPLSFVADTFLLPKTWPNR